MRVVRSFDRGLPSIGRLDTGRLIWITYAFCLRASTFSGRSTAPPPVAITRPRCLPRSEATSDSMSLKCFSPYLSKISGIAIPARLMISSSMSISSLSVRDEMCSPMVDLPQPGIPMRTIFLICFCMAVMMRSFSPVKAPGVPRKYPAAAVA